MNGYNLIRAWYNFKFENPEKVKAKHSDFYCYLVDQWNRLGQKQSFGLPTSYTMECLNIGSYNTYKSTLNDLVDFGFVKILKESKNQHQSKIVALSNFDKALDKALDKATTKALDKAPDTITKQITKEQITNNKENQKTDFDYDLFLKFINDTLGRKLKVIKDSDKKKVRQRLKEGYTKFNFQYAVENCKNAKVHIESGYKYCTFEFFTRPKTLDQYGEKPKEQKNQIGGHTEYYLKD